VPYACDHSTCSEPDPTPASYCHPTDRLTDSVDIPARHGANPDIKANPDLTLLSESRPDLPVRHRQTQNRELPWRLYRPRTESGPEAKLMRLDLLQEPAPILSARPRIHLDDTALIARCRNPLDGTRLDGENPEPSLTAPTSTSTSTTLSQVPRRAYL